MRAKKWTRRYVVSTTRRRGRRRRFLLAHIRRKVAFLAAKSGHKTDAVLHLDHTGPAFFLDVTPAIELARLRLLRIARGGKKEELHALFRNGNLRNAMAFVVIEDPRAGGLQIRELGRDVVVLEPILHEEQIA